MRARKRLKNFVQAGAARVRKLRAPAAVAEVERFNVQDANSAPEMLTFLDSARRKCADASRDFGLAITTAVIGHTHHARIAVHEDAGEFFALVDCGAWIEDCVTEDDPTPRPNAQVAASGPTRFGSTSWRRGNRGSSLAASRPAFVKAKRLCGGFSCETTE